MTSLRTAGDSTNSLAQRAVWQIDSLEGPTASDLATRS